jgi:hypothetical protein
MLFPGLGRLINGDQQERIDQQIFQWETHTLNAGYTPPRVKYGPAEQCLMVTGNPFGLLTYVSRKYTLCACDLLLYPSSRNCIVAWRGNRSYAEQFRVFGALSLPLRSLCKKHNDMNKKNEREPESGKEQNSDRATSGGGLGQGRETAAGMPREQMEEKNRPGKGMGGTSDTGGHQGEEQNGTIQQGPSSSTTTSDVRPSKAGKAGRVGGEGIDITDHDTDQLNSPSSGSEWSGQRGMGAASRNKDLKEKITPTNVGRKTEEDN